MRKDSQQQTTVKSDSTTELNVSHQVWQVYLCEDPSDLRQSGKSRHGLCQQRTDHAPGAKPENGSFIAVWEETVRLIVNWQARQVCCQNAKDAWVSVVQVQPLKSLFKYSMCAIHLCKKSVNDTVLIKATMDNFFYNSLEKIYIFPGEQCHCQTSECVL